MRFKMLQQIVDICRGKFFGLDAMVKKHEMMTFVKSYTTMAFGSSHMEHGFIPNENEINLGSPSQDLYYIYNLYKKFNTPEVKKVLITFSVFSPGDRLICSGLGGMTIIYKHLYNIPYEDINIAKEKHYLILEPFFKHAIKKAQKKLKLKGNYRGALLERTTMHAQDEETLKKRALLHYKISQREKIPMEYCKKILEETKQNNQEVYFILPPALNSFKNYLPNSDELFKEIYTLVEDFSHAKILNLYDDPSFSNEDFIDGDHPNESGAIKMTAKMHEFINS